MKLLVGTAVAACLFSLPHASAQEAKLLASDGVAADYFGSSLAISGTTALVGAPGDDDNGSLSGTAYLFDITDPSAPVETAKLLASDGAAGDEFGVSVAISGTTALVGAFLENELGPKSGAAYLYDATTGAQLAKLLASDGAAGDMFSLSVAMSGTAVLVGAPSDDDSGTESGSAYLFDVSSPSAPVQIAKLLANDGDAHDNFGRSVAISGTTALVGAWWDDDSGTNSGSAYLYDATTGAQTAKLLASDGAPGDEFGYSVAISGTTALVGAKSDDASGSYSGSAYLFDVTNPASPVQTAKLLASDGAAGDWFGCSVAISGTTALVGARFDEEDGFTLGSAYLFDVTTGQEIAKLRASDGAPGDDLGKSVALSGDAALVGATWDDDNGTDSGSAMLFGPLHAATWTSRDGILGLNPTEFTCSDAPVLGSTWSTQVSTAPSIGSVTVFTFVAVGFGGPTEGISVFGHELLILPPFLSFPVVGPGLGAHDFPVPIDLALLGLSGSWQGARLEVVPSGPFFLVLTNALDVVYGL